MHEVEHAGDSLERIDKAIDDAIAAAPPEIRQVVQALLELCGVGEQWARRQAAISAIARRTTSQPSRPVTWSLAAGSHSITVVYGGDGNDTGSTSRALTEIVNAPPPGAPSNLTANAANSNTINLTWTASPTSGVTYIVYSSANAVFTPSASNRIASGLTNTSYSNTGLSQSTRRYYVVTAQNANGESAASNEAGAITKGG